MTTECYECGAPATFQADIYRRDDGRGDPWENLCTVCVREHIDAGHIAVRLRLDDAQERALRDLCERYSVEFDPLHYRQSFDLPLGYVSGWVGGHEHAPLSAVGFVAGAKPTIYVGVSPAGEVSS